MRENLILNSLLFIVSYDYSYFLGNFFFIEPILGKLRSFRVYSVYAESLYLSAKSIFFSYKTLILKHIESKKDNIQNRSQKIPILVYL
jgi:hypothetical protein